MNRSKYYQWQAVLLLGVLMFSLLIASPVFADEATPPPAEASGEESAPADESTPPVETETGESAPEESIAGNESAPAEETVAEILEQVPADTEVIVLDENGEVLPLVTEAAEEAIILKDPIWCPAGVAPKPGIGGCSGSFPNLSSLVAGFVPPAKNGVIWIEFGTDNGAEVEIDGGIGGNWETATNYSLTLQGGWIGTAGPVGSGAIVGTTEFDTAISIVNWNGAVTINDISFNNANNTANPTTGSLYVETTKNIVVSNVMVINSTGASNDGALLDNRPSTTQATVTVKNSTFNGNIFRGLTVYSDGAVTLTNVTAHFNTNDGVYISNDSDSTASVVSVTKGFFNQNGDEGLYIISNGAVKLSQITASTNFGTGVDVDNRSAPTPQAVTVSGFLHANANSGSGLIILSDGAVTLTSLIANMNGNQGVYIDNDNAAKPYTVTINGYNSMSLNSFSGLSITTLGVVTINNITANGNGASGVYIDNQAAPLYANSVNIIGVNSFNSNGNLGLNVLSRGAINVYNLTANENGYASDLQGVILANDYNALKPQNITLFGINTFNSNSNTGLMVLSYGIITLNNITANFNGEGVNNGLGNGAYIGNSLGTLPKPVILKGTNTFNGNDESGLLVYSLGTISVSNITASSNSVGVGAYFDNNPSTIAAPVTITGYGVFDNNATTGLYVFSNGAITTTNLSAAFNNDNGVYLNTIGVTKIQAVNMKGNNTFIGNGNSGSDSGLVVYADGNITVNNLTASQNYYDGAVLNNFTNWNTNGFTTFGSVTVTGFGNFHNNNLNSGLYIYTKGNATMSYVTANQNSNDGVGINAQGKVNLTCVLVTENAYGLYMYTSATTLTIKGLSAVGNTTQNESLAYALMIRSRCP